MALIAGASCGGSPGSQPSSANDKAGGSTEQASTPSDDAAACGPKEGAAIDSMACLVAAERHAASGDADGAKKTLELGCKQGDIDACASLRTLDPSRAAELEKTIASRCGALGDLGKKLAACVRGHTTETIEDPHVPAKLSFAVALDLRAAYGPKLLLAAGAAVKACKASVAGPVPASLAGTSVEKESAFLDATIQCEGGSPMDVKALREGEITNSDATPRALHDAFISTDSTLRVSAPTGDAEVGVFCPSVVVDDDRAADVFVRKKEGDMVTTVLAAVRIAEPCWNADALAARAKERKVLEKIIGPIEPAIKGALDKLAAACDDQSKLDRKKSPLAGDALEKTKGILSFEGTCTFGYHGFGFVSPKPLNHPGQVDFITEFLSASGHAMRVQAFKQLPDRLEFAFRKKNAELVIAVKKP